MQFLTSAGRGEELNRRFAKFHISGDGDIKDIGANMSDTASLTRLQCDTAGLASQELPEKDLSIIMMAMRKLREGIMASKRCDDFSTQAYFFCIRLSILAKHMESYHPALLYLLNKLHTRRPLSKVDVEEFAGYLMLDLACRQRDLAQAHVIRRRFNVVDVKVNDTLSALTHDNYYLFWKTKRSVDGHKTKMMEFAEPAMRMHALKCLGRTYFQLEKDYVEQVTSCTWESLVADHAVGWELQDTKVIIRKPKAR